MIPPLNSHFFLSVESSKLGIVFQVFWDYECLTEWEIIIHMTYWLYDPQPSMKLDPTGEIPFNSCSSGAPGSPLSKLPCSQACLLPAVISGVALTQHDFAFAVKNDVVPPHPLLQAIFTRAFPWHRTTSVVRWLASKHIRPLRILMHWRNLCPKAAHTFISP